MRKQLPVVTQSTPAIATTLGLFKSGCNGRLVAVEGVRDLKMIMEP